MLIYSRLLSQEGNTWTTKQIQQCYGDKRNTCMKAVLYTHEDTLFLPKALFGMSWKKITNSWFELSSFP